MDVFVPEILLIGEYSAASVPHQATLNALRHAATSCGRICSTRWISTSELSVPIVRDSAGIWIAPGSPYRDLKRTLDAIQCAREERIPCLGTCGGFQHMVLEYARNVLGFQDAEHAEYDPNASRLFISRLSCSLVGRELKLKFAAGSRAAQIYGALSAIESYYCNFGVNPEFVEPLRSGPLQISGSDDEGEVRVIELPDHPFFMGTLFLPQIRSQEQSPHPLVLEFIRQAT